MSRLDWFTILIVSVCVVALGFLVYKTVQLMGNDKAPPRTEISKGNSASDDKSALSATGEAKKMDQEAPPAADEEDLDDDELTYDPQEVEAPGEKPATAAKQEEPRPTPAETSTSKRIETPAAENRPKAQQSTAPATTAKGTTTTGGSSTGEYMVVAGSFSQRFNAENQVKYLKDLGYSNASVEIFNNGALASALVDRFTSQDAAKRLVSELKGKGVEAIVKKKQ